MRERGSKMSEKTKTTKLMKVSSDKKISEVRLDGEYANFKSALQTVTQSNPFGQSVLESFKIVQTYCDLLSDGKASDIDYVANVYDGQVLLRTMTLPVLLEYCDLIVNKIQYPQSSPVVSVDGILEQ
jgi:hypothetical protein